MDEQIKALVSQIRILETEANNKHTPAERTALFRAAGKLKNQVATLLNQQGKGQQQQQGSKIPDPNDYFDNLTPDMKEYFRNSLTPEMEQYFDNLTDEQKRYFSPDKNIAHFDNAPDAPKQPEKAKADDEEAALRKRIYAALGIFY